MACHATGWLRRGEQGLIVSNKETREKADPGHAGRDIAAPVQRTWITIGALAGLTAVAMAAFAAHGIPDPNARRIVASGVQMQGWHALALFGTGLWAPRGGRTADAAGAAFTLGLLLFCGAVYALALAGVSLGATAPAGGMLLMLGWLLLAVSAIRAR